MNFDRAIYDEFLFNFSFVSKVNIPYISPNLSENNSSLFINKSAKIEHISKSISEYRAV